ncbi:MAG: glycoside hydrolase family 2 [Oscillospiraceae bacterium]|nr:glycoside hydrolase family 2 [Oscillospiraceae bacterium]
MATFKTLFTAEGEEKNMKSWDLYPRPQLRRDSFLPLGGSWDFAVSRVKSIPEEFPLQIQLPFPPESALSGLQRITQEGEYLYYKRTFKLPENFLKEKLLLHIGAADQIAHVWVNGSLVGSHKGGYLPFTFDITHLLQEENTLIIGTEDHLDDHILPYGKQRRDRGGMWYTPVSGIWQTVWLESVPEEYISSLRIDVTQDSFSLAVSGAKAGIVTVKTETGDLTFPLEEGVCHGKLDHPHLWSPEDPYLYSFTIQTAEDRISSYFALRTLEIKKVDGLMRLCLNGKPYFFHGLLDQGYWSDGLFTPASPENYIRDIKEMKALGFNMLRKHIKIEPEIFYYACDRLGMAVFQDFVNNGDYSFFRDTALPTIGIKRLNDRHLHKDPLTRAAFLKSMKETVNHLYNHPCIVYWTIFNEGWGQFDSSLAYEKLKEMDNTRFIDSASGWFGGGKSDVQSEHVYFKKVKLKAGKKPLVLSEFGGYSHKVEGHVFNTEKAYGYGKCETREDFVSAVCRLYEDEILPLVKKGLCAAVYTQVSDVEDEINGLLTYDRRVQKLLPEEFLPISQALTSAIREK